MPHHAVLILGFALGLVSALFFAFYMVPQKVLKLDTISYLGAISLGVLLTSLLPYAWSGFPHNSTWLERGEAVLCGLMWGLGTMAFSASITRIGMALATPIKNTTGVLGTLVGLIILREWHTTNPWLTLLGSGLIVGSAIMIGFTGHADVPRRHTLSGVALALGAACCYASYLYPLNRVVASVGYVEFTPWMAVGIVITAGAGVLLRPGGVRVLQQYPLSAYAWSLLGGASWTIALYALAASMDRVGLAISWSLAQLNTLPAVFMGIVFFHEVSFRAHAGKILLGLLCATAGTIFLAMAK
jgi:glucose uptake protein